MKRFVKASKSEQYSSKDEAYEKLQEIISETYALLDKLYAFTPRASSYLDTKTIGTIEECESSLDQILTKFASVEYDLDKYKVLNQHLRRYGIDSSTEIYGFETEEEIDDDDLPKGYYDEYYGQTAYNEWGDLVAEECAGKVISKKVSESEEPGGLIYEANQLGIDDFFELLQCLEGMCYNGKAVEISDYQYKVL